MGLFTLVAFSQTFTSQKLSAIATAHNFANGSGGGNPGYTFASATGTCSVCHASHRALSTAIALWNHQVPAAGTFTPYNATSSSTINGAVDLATGGSLLCLSCHDGTASLDAFGARVGAIQMTAADLAYASMGKVLTDEHPVSIVYPADGSAAADQLKVRASHTNVKLYNNKVECASCHSMHNPTVIGKLLVVSNANSAMCIQCHDK